MGRMATIKERFETLRAEATAELARLEREAREAREVLAALGGKAVSTEPPTPTQEQADGAREYAAEGAHAAGKRAFYGRNLNARKQVADALMSGPKTVEDLALAAYGAAGSHEVGKAERVVGHMARDGQVVVTHGRVRRAA
jgi:hypothetical protein